MTARNPTGRSEATKAASVAAFGVALLAPALCLAEVDLDALRACTSEQNDLRRLVCYDEAMGVAAQPQSPAPAAAAAGAAAAASAPQAAAPSVAPAEAQAKFGYRGAIARKDLEEQARANPGAERMDAEVVELERRPHGQLVLTLDNGQVWAQKTAETARVKVGDRIAIKKGSFNSFLLVLPNNTTVRVAREK
jgi:hypothetical protein